MSRYLSHSLWPEPLYEDVEGGEDCECCQNTDNTLLYDWDLVEAWLCPQCALDQNAERISE
jgi:hypothetical protein